MLWALCCALLAGAVTSQNFEESFTIFIDLDDFHITQAGNHEFLAKDAIGEHDNVVLHMSEEEMRYHQDLHNTHSCEAPSETHEVVSFIQEKMYETPLSPSFIDDVISSNYGVGNNLWEQLKMAQQPMPFPPSMWQGAPQMPTQQRPQATQPQAAVAPAPVASAVIAESKFDAPSSVSAKAPESTKTPEEEEEDAVARFRDAYRAFKLLNHAVEGLGPYTAPATQALTSTSGSSQKSSLLDSLVDDDDRRIMDLLTSHKTNPFLGMFSSMMKGKTGPSDEWKAMMGENAPPPLSIDQDEVNKIVDDAMKAAFNDPAPAPAVSAVASETSTQSTEHRRHHHHHHKDNSLAVAQPEERKDDLDDTEKAALKTLLMKLTADDKNGKLKEALHEALFPGEKLPETPKSAPIASSSIPVITVDAPKPEHGASRPLPPLSTSHIEKSPNPADFIPESVYSQQAVPFSEKLPEIVKHVPKRILIPRMEEPGPVIGGSSRPVHIQIPSSDILDIKSSTRPSAPSQMLLSSDITTTQQVAVQTSVDATNKADVSVKASSVAAANDEALTQPEVVIF